MRTYILRVDDVNEYMCRNELEALQKLSREINDSLMIAVIPFCKDKKLISDNSIDETDYWKALNYCQSQGSIIGLHGYNHKLKTINWWNQIYPVSELGELMNDNDLTISKKISMGIKKLEDNGLKVEFYAPPAHGINYRMIKALKENKIDVVSEGFFKGARNWLGICWIPVKCWRLDSISIGEFSTVCLHLYTKASQQVIEQVPNKRKQLSKFRNIRDSAKYLGLDDVGVYVMYYVYFACKHITRRIRALVKK